MSQIKARLLSFYTKRLIRRRRADRMNVGFVQAQTIGILYHGDSPKKQVAVDWLASELKKLGKQVSILCYVTDSKQAANFTDPTITLQDIPLLGKITHPQAGLFLDTSFDYLYQVDLEGQPAIDYLLVRSKANCRVGYYRPARAVLFEVMVSLAKHPEEGDIANLTAQMLHYTQLLKTE